MTRIAFLAHLPLLRIEADRVPFANGDLRRMPFDTYRELTQGAFHRPREYAATAPVFYRVFQDLPGPLVVPRVESDGSRVAQYKTPSNRSSSPLIEGFHSLLVEPVWTALMLAAPAMALPSPRLSCTLVIPPDDAVFNVDGERFTAIHDQGDADHEYLFNADAAVAPVGADVLGRAAELVPRVAQLKKDPDLAAALSVLLSTCAPSLTRVEQLTLSVIALEALLLPDIRSGLGPTLKRRGAALLAGDAEQEAALGQILKMLYDLRSAGVHGGNLRHAQDTLDAVRYAFGPQLLAAAILEVGERAADGGLERLRAALDQEERATRRVGAFLPLAPPPVLGSSERLLEPRVGTAAALAGSLPGMAVEEGVVGSWAPLIGLHPQAESRLGENQGGALMTLSGQEALALEQGDVRGDFMAPMMLAPHTHAVYFTVLRNEDPERLEECEASVIRDRDLGVIALRLAGFTRFYDPELLGAFVYWGSIRRRQPTVIRQTVQTRFLAAPVELFPADGQRLTAPFLKMLIDYDARRRHPDVEHVLTMFRRGFDRRFLPEPASAGLLFSTLEAMLGRFRRKDAPVQLETLVERAAGPGPAVDWFKAKGKAVRNAVAHGRFRAGSEEDPALEQVRSLLVAIVPKFLACWLEATDERVRPGELFIERMSSYAAGDVTCGGT